MKKSAIVTGHRYLVFVMYLSALADVNAANELNPYLPGVFAGTIQRPSTQVTGDFNADGRSDLASFYPHNGTWKMGLSDGSSFVTADWAVLPAGSSWTSQMVGDFDGNGMSDIANFSPGNGTWWVSLSNGAALTTTQWADLDIDSGWTKHLVGDFNGDGLSDIANFHPSNGTWWVSLSNGASFTTTQWADLDNDSGWTQHLVGDFNGDGLSDIANFHSSSATWWVSISNGVSFTTTEWVGRVNGLPWASAYTWRSHLVADLDRDGKTDIVSVDYHAGDTWGSLSNGTSFQTMPWIGSFMHRRAQGLTVVGDFNGDGFSDVALQRTQSSCSQAYEFSWYVTLTDSTPNPSLWSNFPNRFNDPNNCRYYWVNALVGDFDGDAVSDIATYDWYKNNWWVSLSTRASFVQSSWAY